MTTLREAATQALEALEGGADSWQLVGPAIDAIKEALVEDAMQKFTDVSQEIEAALAEPVQEPVAWSYELATTMLEHRYDGWEHLITRYKPNVPEGSIRNLTPLFAAPPQRLPLTDDQLDDIAVAARTGNLYDLRIAIERAHKIK